MGYLATILLSLPEPFVSKISVAVVGSVALMFDRHYCDVFFPPE